MRTFIFSCILFMVSTISFAVVPDPGSRGIDWDVVQSKVERFDWAKEIVREMQRDIQHTQDWFTEPPLGLTGWLHEYYCEKDARRLQFDPKKPTEHICPHCKTVYSGAPYDDCWRSMVHSRFAETAYQAGILYRLTKEETYLQFAKKTLLWYADHFHEYAPHGNHAGKGIIREQSLDESTQLVRMALAYWDICPFLTDAERNTIAEKYFLPDAKFIQQQTRIIHNIHSWHNAAVGLVGLALGEKELSNAALDGPFGLKEQIQKGVNDDGFWYEGSISYHFYTISSLQDLYAAAKAQNIPLDGTDKFIKMFTAPLDFAFPNGQLPANNDCWYDQQIASNKNFYETASGIFSEERFDRALARFYQAHKREGLAALLFGKANLPKPEEEHPHSVLFESTGIAILRNQTANLLLKYGPYGGGHDHLDRLNLMLFSYGALIMPDLGTSGYGIGLNKWYRSPAAHNMLVVDEAPQARKGGYLVAYKEQAIHAGTKEAYPGVTIERNLILQDNGFSDDIQVKSDELHTYDLIYHIRGTLQTEGLELKPYTTLSKKNGYEYIKNPVSLRVDQSAQLRWSLPTIPGFLTAGILTMDCQSEHPFEIITGTCPDNPADHEMSILILRLKDKTWNVKTKTVIEGI